MIRVAYNLLTFLLTPFIYLWLLRRATRGKEDRSRLPERLGHAPVARPAGTLIWLHAASVGEAQSVLTLARELLKNESVHLLITTGTVTSARMVQQQHFPRTIHQFIPIDTYVAVRRFLQHWQPNLVLWVESEFWPQLLWQVRARRIPALLINARMSEKSLRGWQRFPKLFQSMLSAFTTIYAGSEDDAKRLRILGAQVNEAGNLKFDAAPLPYENSELVILLKQLGGRPVWLAASTHAGEELQIAQLHKNLRASFPELLTLIVPRHATRGEEIATTLATEKLSVAQRSQHTSITPQTDIYLADTMGELGLFYRAAPIVFIGGSLVPHGGHNPLEPALHDCAIISGPHTYNFTDIFTHMQQQNGVKIVENASQLETVLLQLLASPETVQALAKNAQQFVQSQQGATSIIVQHITSLLAGA